MHQVEPVGEYRSQWGEGPIWHNGRLIYVDIERGKVIRLNPESGEEKVWDVMADVGRVGTVVPRESGGFVLAGDNGFFYLSENNEIEHIGNPEPDKADNRFNDGKCAPDGHFFAGTISLVKKEGDAKLYKLSNTGEISPAHGPVTNSNGIVWNAAGDTMFYIDTPTRKVVKFPYAKGEIGAAELAVDTSEIDASPDGMAIDSDDNLWVAFCHGGCVVKYSSSTGELLEKIEIPCLETTACAFGSSGGEELDTLYVSTGIHKTEIEEHAGLIMKVTGLKVKGQQSSSYQG